MPNRTPGAAGPPGQCVILVPFSGFIHRECEDALQQLERRGYPVRRVGGYAAIDAARSQMATDAMRDGFEETLWIDSDVGFNPDDVDRLREHNLPVVCGIYPKKGQRAIACHVIPGERSMVFGQAGGLVEILYAATGFLLVRSDVYRAVQQQARLPVCNESFGHPLVPYFQPIVRPLDGGYWYLSEDYSFCHRVRECGIKILADTSIRLWHIGTYRYGWENAGIELERVGTFTLNFSHEEGRSSSADVSRLASADGPLERLAAQYPWPTTKPAVRAFPDRNWLFPATRELLSRTLPGNAKLIVEIGSWTGLSTRYLADLAPAATVIAIDHWQGSPEHQQDPDLAPALPQLHDAFLRDCWEYRNRIIPLRAPSVAGLRLVREHQLRPDLVYIDGNHSHEAVVADLTTALELFPTATIVGDDWDWEGVRTAVEAVARQGSLQVDVLGAAWRIPRRT